MEFKTVDLIVPCYNESDVLELFYKETSHVLDSLPQYEFHILFINDGSRDTTLNIIKRLAKQDRRVQYLSLSRNFGKEAAMLAGLKYSKGDCVGFVDADLQHSPALIPGMLNALEEGYDIAAARRTTREGEGRFKSLCSNLFYKIINRMSDVDIASGSQDFRFMRRKVANAILQMPEYHRFSKGIFSWVGFETKWFEHENRERAAGSSKWSFWRLFRYAVEGIISFSTVPLKISLLLGALFSVGGFGYGIYIFIRTLILGPDVNGYPSIICLLTLFGGLILLCLGVIGEYLSRIYIEVKHRPVFLVDETNLDDE